MQFVLFVSNSLLVTNGKAMCVEYNILNIGYCVIISKYIILPAYFEMQNTITRNDLIVFILKNEASKKRRELILCTDAELRQQAQKIASTINLRVSQKRKEKKS